MTDETYAVNTSLPLQGEDKRRVMFVLAVMCQTYWCIGAVLGSLIGSLLPFSAEGIDFSMTALFVIIFVSQWEKAESHFAAIAGIVVSLGCLFVFGPDHFMLPALAFVSILLAAYNQHKAVVK